MAMSNTTTAATNERPIPQWFVVTNSSLEGPALVSTPQDCWKHMNTRNQNHSNNGCRPPDAKAFYNIQDAIPYFEKLVKQHNVNSSSSQKEAAKSAMKALRAQAAGRTTDASPTKKRKLYHPETRAIAPPPPPTPTTTTTTTTTPTSSIPPLLTKAAPIIPPGSVATFAAYGMMAALAAPSFATTTTSNIPATLPHPSPPPPFPSPPPGAPKLKPEVDPEVDKQEKFNETFDRYLKLLKEFKNVYGDTDCPSRDGVYQVSNGQTINFKRYFGLGRWCSQIRTQLQIYDIAPNQSKLSKDQVQELRLIHFCRTPERHLETQSVFKEDHYQRLKYFHEKYGHSNVHWHKNTGLTIICSNLQAAYQRKQAGKTTMLTDEHVARLDAIEFSWTLKAARPTFDESATQWLAYKAKHNGQEPPAKQQLGCWAGHIRQKYHAKQQGKPSTLTEEQIQKLTDWGFRWESLKAPSALPVRKPKTFEERLVELQDYKDKFGDCLVPQKYPSLGHWARAVRRDYILYFEGQKTSLTDERVMSLGQMGFLFCGFSPSTGEPYRISAFLRHDNIIPYEQQIEMLCKQGFALWDIVKACRRPGSLDQHIDKDVPYDVHGFCQKHPSITRIVIANGKSGFTFFKKHFRWWLDSGELIPNSDSASQDAFSRWVENDVSLSGIKVICALPVSPAAAAYSYKEKRVFWEENVYQPGLEEYHKKTKAEPL